MPAVHVHSATKAAVKTFFRWTANYTHRNGHQGITIQPGIVETDFSRVRFHGDVQRAATHYQGIMPRKLRISQTRLFMRDQSPVQITEDHYGQSTGDRFPHGS